MSLSIKVEAMIGDYLLGTLVDSWELGAKLNLCVSFSFNDCSAFCYPDGRAHMTLPEGMNHYRLVGRETVAGGTVPIVQVREYRGGADGTWSAWRRLER